MNNTITLKDKGVLGFSEFGDPSGEPVFFFHGSGGSRLDHPADGTILNEIGIRFIATDRPGHGLSDNKENRTLLDWADNISELADYLKIDKFYVLGHSAGGPYALSCAYKLKARVIKCGIVSGLGPYNRPKSYKGLPFAFKILMFLIRNVPKINFFLRKQMSKVLELDNQLITEKLISGFPKEDQQHMRKGRNSEVLVKAIKEGYIQGYNGPALDDIIINSPWGFTLNEIDTPTIIWHGKKDRNVPFVHGEYQHSMIKNCKFHEMKEEAHLFILSCWAEILSELVEHITVGQPQVGLEVESRRPDN